MSKEIKIEAGKEYIVKYQIGSSSYVIQKIKIHELTENSVRLENLDFGDKGKSLFRYLISDFEKKYEIIEEIVSFTGIDEMIKPFQESLLHSDTDLISAFLGAEIGEPFIENPYSLDKKDIPNWLSSFPPELMAHRKIGEENTKGWFEKLPSSITFQSNMSKEDFDKLYPKSVDECFLKPEEKEAVEKGDNSVDKMSKNIAKGVAELMFDSSARKYMVEWNLKSFKRSHPKLFKAIIEAICNH